MSQYLIEPEVPGSLGENTLANFDLHPPIIEKLHFQFDGWLSDDLLTSYYRDRYQSLAQGSRSGASPHFTRYHASDC